MSWAEDLDQAPVNPEAAARVLGHVASFLRRGDALPPMLAHYLADAFEVIATKETPEERVTMAGRELNLVRPSPGRPPKATVKHAQWAEASVVFDDGVPYSKTAVHRALMRQAGVKDRTAWSLLRKLQQERMEEGETLQKLG